jgi:hypothetical protein
MLAQIVDLSLTPNADSSASHTRARTPLLWHLTVSNSFHLLQLVPSSISSFPRVHQQEQLYPWKDPGQPEPSLCLISP